MPEAPDQDPPAEARIPDAGAIRQARPADVPEIIQLIRDLAAYERAPNEAVATEAQLLVALFGGSSDVPNSQANTPGGVPSVYCLVVEAGAEDPRRLAGLAIWFLNFSTWRGQHGIYLEDLFVRPEYRGRGFGKLLLARLAQIAIENEYARLEWWVLDWNEPALEFYRRLKAVPMTEWTVHRVTEEALTDLASAPRPETPPVG